MSICHQFDKNPLFSVFWARIAVPERQVITVSFTIGVKFSVFRVVEWCIFARNCLPRLEKKCYDFAEAYLATQFSAPVARLQIIDIMFLLHLLAWFSPPSYPRATRFYLGFLLRDCWFFFFCSCDCIIQWKQLDCFDVSRKQVPCVCIVQIYSDPSDPLSAVSPPDIGSSWRCSVRFDICVARDQTASQ